jgi:hypothetical protein
VLANRHPVLEWMVGRDEGGNLKPEGGNIPRLSPGGECLDMARDGALAGFLAEVTPEWLAERSRGARARAVGMFSQEAVIGKYVEYYRQVMSVG